MTPMPSADRARVAEQAARGVAVVQLMSRMELTTIMIDPIMLRTFSFRRFTIRPAQNAPMDQAKLKGTMARPNCAGVLPRAPLDVERAEGGKGKDGETAEEGRPVRRPEGGNPEEIEGQHRFACPFFSAVESVRPRNGQKGEGQDLGRRPRIAAPAQHQGEQHGEDRNREGHCARIIHGRPLLLFAGVFEIPGDPRGARDPPGAG